MTRAATNAGSLTISPWQSLWALFGDRAAIAGQPAAPKAIRRRDLTFIFRNLSTLLENGVSLPKALAAVSREKTMQRHAPMLDAIRRKIETGELFSTALAAYPATFNELMVSQVRVGERSGTLAETLTQVTSQQEKMNALRSHVIKKLSYPVVLAVMGTGVVAFMLIYVIPVFEETYADAKVPLPLVTQFMIAVGNFAAAYYWIVLLAGATGFLAIKHFRRKPKASQLMDQWLLRIPIVGNFLRDIAVLQLMDVLGNLMEAGFLVAEALGVCAGAIGNRAVRQRVWALQSAIQRGERLSHELQRHSDVFPPVVSQLVIIGEQTGNLAKATGHIRDHLRREIEETTNVMVGTIEPVLTISLAAAISVILLSIYLPMFDMISAVSN